MVRKTLISLWKARRYKEKSLEVKTQGPATRSKRLTRHLRGVRGVTFGGQTGRQNVVVKVHICYHNPKTVKRLTTRLAKYLAREYGGEERAKLKAFSAELDQAEIRRWLDQWQSDKWHFRLVITPEHGSKIPDFSEYVRAVMARVQQDLGTGLDWVAVTHQDTDHLHAHVVLRGRDHRGRELRVSRDYLVHGIRDRAADQATEILGERTLEKPLTKNRASAPAAKCPPATLDVSGLTWGPSNEPLELDHDA